MRHGPGARIALGFPLVGAGRALGQLPFEAEKDPKEVVAPLCGRVGPGDFRASADRIGAFARAKAALPAEALFLDRGRFGLGADMFGITGPVGLAERMAAGDEGHRLFVVHRHASEDLADIARRGYRVRIAVGTFRVHIDEAHLNCGQRIFEFPVTGVALVSKPFALGPPVDVLFRFPDILTPAGKTKGLETHRLESDIAGEDHQIGPGNLPAVFLLDRPEQPARLVEVHIIGPAIQGRKALTAVTRAPAAVADAVGAGAVPRHPDQQGAVMAEVGRPPVLRLRHQLMEILLYGLKIQALELFGIVEIRSHRIGLGGTLVEHIEVQPVRPPVPDRPASAGHGAKRWSR